MHTGTAKPRRSFAEWLTISIVGLGAIWFVAQVWKPSGPRRSGRTALEWVSQLFELSHRQHEDAVVQALAEARLALMEMGTNAVPALVRASLADARSSPLRSLLRPMVGVLGGHIGYPGDRAYLTLALLRDLRPAAAAVLPHLEASLRDGGEPMGMALQILKQCCDADGQASAEWERRRAAGGAGLPVRTCEQVLIHLRPASPASVAAALAQMPTGSTGRPEWAAVHALVEAGPLAVAAVPTLERHLDEAATGQLGEAERVHAAVALLEIDPRNEVASAWMRSRVWLPAYNSWNNLTNATAEALWSALNDLRQVRASTTLDVLETLVRDEVGAWETRGLGHQLSPLLERFAPARAAPIFASQMTSENKDNIRLVAAGALLRSDRADTNAVAVLAACLRDDHALVGMAAEQLQSAVRHHPDLPTLLESAGQNSDRVRRILLRTEAEREYARLAAARSCPGRGAP